MRKTRKHNSKTVSNNTTPIPGSVELGEGASVSLITLRCVVRTRGGYLTRTLLRRGVGCGDLV